MRCECIIYDQNEYFAKRFMSALTARAKHLFRVQLFTQIDKLCGYLKSDCPQLLIVGEDSFSPEILKQYTGKLLILSESEEERGVFRQYSNLGNEQTETVELFVTFRYQSIDRIYQRIAGILGDNQERTKSIDIYGIYSPCALVNQSEFALQLARKLAEKYRVLYLNFDEFSGLSEVLTTQSGQTLSDAMYYYRQQQNQEISQLDQIITQKEGLDYFAPVTCAEDIAFVDTQQWINFVTLIGKKCGYEVIVLEISSAIKEPWRLLDQCSCVFVPTNAQYVNQQKIRELKQYCAYSGMERLLELIRDVELPETEGVTMDFWTRIAEGRMYEHVNHLWEQMEQEK